MGSKVKIGERWVGEGEPCFVVAEIGINHNGDLDIARKLIAAALLCGCDAVKFQKRTIEAVYSQEEPQNLRRVPLAPPTEPLNEDWKITGTLTIIAGHIT